MNNPKESKKKKRSEPKVDLTDLDTTENEANEPYNLSYTKSPNDYPEPTVIVDKHQKLKGLAIISQKKK